MHLGKRLRARSAALLALTVTTGFGMLLFACSSTTVGTGGSGDDDDDDSGAGVDAGHDSGVVAKADASSDGGTTVHGDGGGGGGGGGGDGGDEGGTCGPTSLDNSVVYHAPMMAPGACTAEQIADFVDDCGENPTGDCATFESSLPTTCLQCLATDVRQTTTTWGALLTDSLSDIQVVNTAGCIAAIDPSNQDCAETVESTLECESAECDIPCADFDFDAQYACENAADDAGCASVVAQANECLDVLPTADSDCLDSDFNTALTYVADTLCGSAR